MRKILANNSLMVFLSGAFFIIGFAIGYILKDFLWFARFGALIVAVGILLLSRSSLIGSDIKIHITTVETGLSHLDSEHYRLLGQEEPEWVKQDRRSRFAVGTLGPAVSAVGTVVLSPFGEPVLTGV